MVDYNFHFWSITHIPKNQYLGHNDDTPVTYQLPLSRPLSRKKHEGPRSHLPTVRDFWVNLEDFSAFFKHGRFSMKWSRNEKRDEIYASELWTICCCLCFGYLWEGRAGSTYSVLVLWMEGRNTTPRWKPSSPSPPRHLKSKPFRREKNFSSYK